MEFPHLLRLIEQRPVRHDLPRALLVPLVPHGAADLRGARAALFDVEELPTHGGSLRIYGCHEDDTGKPLTDARAASCSTRERAAGFERLETYLASASRCAEDKRELLALPDRAARRDGQAIAGYGAPAKGNTLLNYCGVGTRLPRLHVRPQPAQAGPLPARHAHPDPRARTTLRETRPDYVLILPWNLKDEIMEQLAYIREWGGRFLVRAPDLRVSTDHRRRLSLAWRRP